MDEGQTVSRTRWRLTHGVVFLTLLAGTSLVSIVRIWPLLGLVPVAAYCALVAIVPQLRSTFRPWRFGRVSTPAVLVTIIIAVGSCTVLIAFDILKHPDVSAYRRFLPASSLASLLFVGVVFSVFNALLEEIVFRGILFDSIESQWSAGVAVVVTALLFGFVHMRGYPPGPLGSVLAGFYGLCLGSLRAFTRGIGLPVMAHITADATIFGIVARPLFS